MVTVEQAEKIVLAQIKDYGTEQMYFENALGRVLAEDVKADRDLPPYDRVTMDGIAIQFESFEKGNYSFKIIGTQAAGDTPIEITNFDECVEIMTGAALPSTTDTVIRYEDLNIKDGIATVTINTVTKNQSIHFRGRDKKQNEVVVKANQVVSPVIIQMTAAVGKDKLLVKKLPKVVIISSGDELIKVNETPTPYQIRKSNNYTIKAALQQYRINAEMIHIPDDAEITRKEIEKCLQQYDVIILSGGVSEGKFDYIPKALETCGVEKLFHKVQQRPGKPFWFGKHNNGVLVYAFPGNPVSTFMCLHRYFLLWLEQSLNIVKEPMYAQLNKDFVFNPALQYFLQVQLTINNNGTLLATPVEGNGSGDFANLLGTDAFMELPLEQNKFTKGEVYRIWQFSLASKW
ncbi:molybdopterin molybdotransferase MoeA [Panacibacter ginsenosidivorans]|nr:molybdopterin molybdotransferase MoeA [Panacibacter ginsenosidivorans]